MTDSKYTAILFDLDDTLLNLYACETKALRKALAKVKVNVLDEEWTKIWQIYQGAVNGGIDFCYFNPRSQPINTPLPKYSIKNMSQIIDILRD